MTPDHSLNAFLSGVTTFIGLPLVLEPGPAAGVVLGAPFDGGVIHRPGARMGPWAMRSATLGMGRLPMPLRLQGWEEGRNGWAGLDWVDGGNIPTRPFSTEEALGAVDQHVSAWASKGARPLMLGGDHLMTLGALRALARQHGPLGLLHFDAHPDASEGGVWGTGLHHGTWVRCALEEGLLDGNRCVQIGLRAPRFDSEELALLSDAGFRLWTPGDIRDARLHSQLKGDIARVGQGMAYLSLDLDVLDPAFCPAVAEPVPGGLSVGELVSLLHLAHQWGTPWAGADLMELAPVLEGGESSARVAAHLALHLLI